jgi:hypothetical protein
MFKIWETDKKDVAIAIWKRFLSEVTEAAAKGKDKPNFPVVHVLSRYFLL